MKGAKTKKGTAYNFFCFLLISGLTLVQKIIASAPPNSIAISSAVHKALTKNGLFCFQSIGSILVPPFGPVELFTLTDPTEEAVGGDIFY